MSNLYASLILYLFVVISKTIYVANADQAAILLTDCICCDCDTTENGPDEDETSKPIMLSLELDDGQSKQQEDEILKSASHIFLIDNVQPKQEEDEMSKSAPRTPEKGEDEDEEPLKSVTRTSEKEEANQEKEKKSEAGSQEYIIVPVESEKDEEKSPESNEDEDLSESEKLVKELLRTSKERLGKRLDMEDQLSKKGRTLSRKSRRADLSLLRNFREDSRIREREIKQFTFTDISQKLYNKFNLSNEEIKKINLSQLTDELSSGTIDECRKMLTPAKCKPKSKYRRLDGQCNNLQNERWGSAMICQQRLLPPRYVGISEFRVSKDGESLPNPRKVSLSMHSDNSKPTNYVTHLYTFFGQLLSHDTTMTPVSTTVQNHAVDCCPPEEFTHPQCAPITVSEDDPYYSDFNITCQNFVRSTFCLTCELGQKEVAIEVTSTIDASFIYGNSRNANNILRTNSSGQLRTQRSQYGDLLPESAEPDTDQCSFPQEGQICFLAGDSRVNQHTALTSLHTVFIRQHNRIASDLSELNPHWDDEKIFQEARRILGAQMQVIVYKEYLPTTIGNESMRNFGLNIGRDTTYDENENPTIFVEFSTAAFRFGHSMIRSTVANSPLNTTNELRYLRNEFFQPFELYRGLTGPILKGATTSPSNLMNRYIAPDVARYLYRMRDDDTGLDLAAINLNRGRDHGLPTYVEAVYYCSDNQLNITSFDDLAEEKLMSKEQADLLSENYKHIEDVELWTGILCETHKNSVVGPTAVCILGIQFHKLKYGDRFYFEHKNQAGSFTRDQVRQLRRTTLAKILCLNTKARSLPRNVLIFESAKNPVIQCGRVRDIDLSYWKE